MIINADEVKEFIAKHVNPYIVTTTTIKDGFVSCIGPIHTICGPELHVNRNTRPELDALIREVVLFYFYRRLITGKRN